MSVAINVQILTTIILRNNYQNFVSSRALTSHETRTDFTVLICVDRSDRIDAAQIRLQCPPDGGQRSAVRTRRISVCRVFVVLLGEDVAKESVFAVHGNVDIASVRVDRSTLYRRKDKSGRHRSTVTAFRIAPSGTFKLHCGLRQNWEVEGTFIYERYGQI